MSDIKIDENYHKCLVNKAETYYGVARDLENQAAALMEHAEFMARRGDKLSEDAINYKNTGKLPRGMV